MIAAHPTGWVSVKSFAGFEHPAGSVKLSPARPPRAIDRYSGSRQIGKANVSALKDQAIVQEPRGCYELL